MEGLAARLEEIREPEARHFEGLEATVEWLEAAVLKLWEASRGGLRELRDALAEEQRQRTTAIQRLVEWLYVLGAAKGGRVESLAASPEKIRESEASDPDAFEERLAEPKAQGELGESRGVRSGRPVDLVRAGLAAA
mmetsp:Transcript_34119/g.102895  ORF Transcript_34119/g.102895 Transcript_34119/m.102895 type:complete len:137 (+) Transcript_34119:3-413(+)